MDIAALFAGIHVWSILLFLLGLCFLVAEMLQPGFGVFGVLGIASWVAAVVLTAQTVWQGLAWAGILAVFGLLLFLGFLLLVAKGKIPSRLVLHEQTDKESGFSGTQEWTQLIGQTGKALTDLRPAGCAWIAGARVDVVSRGDYIPVNSEVVVLQTEGNRIVVGLLDNAQPKTHA